MPGGPWLFGFWRGIDDDAKRVIIERVRAGEACDTPGQAEIALRYIRAVRRTPLSVGAAFLVGRVVLVLTGAMQAQWGPDLFIGLTVVILAGATWSAHNAAERANRAFLDAWRERFPTSRD